MNNDSKKLPTYFKYIFLYFLYIDIYLYIGLERHIPMCYGGKDSGEFHFHFFRYKYFLFFFTNKKKGG